MKRLFTPFLAVALLTLVCASTASAVNKYPPGPSYRACSTFPDSMNLFSIEQEDTLLAPCHPATLDTVLGVRGIIVGFDPRGGAFGFYIQNGIGPFTGVDVFTGAFNYLSSVPTSPSGGNLAVGDSVVIYGTTQEFPATNGTTEVEGPDVLQTTDDIKVRKISSGNALPPLKHATPAELNWLPAFSQGEKWEGELVVLKGPLKVGRISGTGIQSPNYLVTTQTASTDSVLIDGFTLTAVAPAAPPVGTAVDSIIGIVNQGTSSAGSGSINSYRIQIRSGNDVFTATPPSLADAYPIEDNQLRLVFDKNLDPTTAQQIARYSLASSIDGSTITNAVLEGGSPSSVVILTINSVLTDGDLETVSVLGVGSLTCPACTISPQQSRQFVNGVLKCADVQKPDPANLPLFDDRSRFAGPGALAGAKFTVRGTGIQKYGSVYYMTDADGGVRGAVSVFGPITPINSGRRYRIAGQVQEFGGESEVINTVLITDEGAGALPAPANQPVSVLRDTTTDQSQSTLTGEDFECMLVKVSYVRVTETRTLGQSFLVAGTKPTYPDTILVSNLAGTLDAYTPPDSAHTVDVTGVLHFTNGSFRVCPRSAADIVDHGLNVGVDNSGPSKLSFSVAPNPARTSTLSFSLPHASNVELGVFDLMGRQVVSLARGTLPAGDYTRKWAGTDASGQRVNPGVYFYRLKVGAETHNVRGVLLQ